MGMGQGGACLMRCHRLSKGYAQGEIIISKDPICFYLVDPATGVVIEKGHSLEGRNIAGKILVTPSGKGSSVVQLDGLFKLSRHNNSPRALIVEYPDPVLVATAIIMAVPMVDQVERRFYDMVRDGKRVIVDANNETVGFVCGDD